MAIRAVLFDLDNTLTDDYASSRQSIVKACVTAAELVPGLSAETLGEAYWRVSLEVWSAVEQALRRGDTAVSSFTGAQYRRECWSQALAACGVTDESVVTRVVESYAYWRDELLPLFPETEEVLAALEAQVKLAIVTNGTADTHRRKLQRLGFDTRFDCCVVAGEVNLAKPDPAIFFHATELLQVPAAECVMVGDNVETDIAGAKAAGMRAVWLNREGFPLPDGAAPDLVVDTLYPVVTLVLQEER